MTSIPCRLRRRSRLRKRFASGALIAALALAAPACAAKRFAAPSDAGVPVPGFAEEWQQVAARCIGVQTMTAELALSGRAGGTRVRGRVQAGFAPGSMRLEGVAPFGQPVFILAAAPSRAVLLLPRDERVARAADAAEILDALVGVRLQADALRAVLAGCAFTGAPLSATSHGPATRHGNLTRFTFPDGVAFVAASGGGVRRIVAAQIQSFLIEYPLDSAGSAWPPRVRISRDLPDGQGVDLTFALSQIETNITIPAEAFTLDVPADTMPMTLAQLRAAGPLGERD